MKIKSIPIVSQIFLYSVQYLLLPCVITIYPSDAHGNFIAITTTTVIVSSVGMVWFSDRFNYWLLGLVPYFVLSAVNHPNNLYGIGYGMFAFELITVAYLVAIVAITEFFVWIAVKVLRKYKLIK